MGESRNSDRGTRFHRMGLLVRENFANPKCDRGDVTAGRHRALRTRLRSLSQKKVGRAGFEPAQQKHLFYRQARLSHVGAAPETVFQPLAAGIGMICT